MEAMKEEEICDEVNETVYIAVSKDLKACKSSLAWTIQNLKGKRICLVHVHQPAQYIYILGGKFHVSSLSEQKVMIHEAKKRQETCKILHECIHIGTKAQVEIKSLYIEKETVESGLMELISEHKIKRLVMGATAEKSYTRKMKEPKSKKAIYVRQHAPSFCHIWFVCKARLIYTREGLKKLHLNNEDQHPVVTSESSISVSIGGSEASFDQSSTFSISELSLSRFAEGAPDSTFDQSGIKDEEPSIQSRIEDVEFSFRSFALPPVTEENQHPTSSLKVQELEENINAVLFIQLDQAIVEAETAKQEAFEESTKRRKAEKDAFEAIRKINAAESLYYEEFS